MARKLGKWTHNMESIAKLNKDHNILKTREAKIYIFCCSSCFDPSELMCICNGHDYEMKVIPVPCSGKIDILYLTKAFESGADGVVIVACKQGECRYLEGNLRAKKRVEAIDSLLDEIGLGKGRIAIIQMNSNGIEQVIREVKDFSKKIQALSQED